MDSSVVNGWIRKRIWPVLRDGGFTRFTPRTAWRYIPTRIEIVNFQSFNSYLAESVGATTYSSLEGSGRRSLMTSRVGDGGGRSDVR